MELFILMFLGGVYRRGDPEAGQPERVVLQGMSQAAGGSGSRLVLSFIPSRGLIGYHGDFMTIPREMVS